jgi:hypothetical protein
MHPFEEALSVSEEDIEFELRGISEVTWDSLLLNPRRLRGSDFLMRWSQGVWSEERITQAINESGEFWALPYGPSGVAPDGDVRAFELYFERLESAGLGRMKRPDLLIFRKEDKQRVLPIVERLGGIEELPFTSEESDAIQELLAMALIAVECENSLWKASQMPDFVAQLKPQKRLNGKPGLRKSAVLPTVIIKEEDRRPLLDWQSQRGIKIHVWQVFYDRAWGMSLDTAETLIAEGLILPTEQIFQAPGGATSKKAIYKFYYHYAYQLGHSHEEPSLVAACITDKNGHILPYVRFEGGGMTLDPEAMKTLRELSNAKD